MTRPCTVRSLPFFLAVLFAVAGCATAAPPSSDALLTSLDKLPKQLATVEPPQATASPITTPTVPIPTSELDGLPQPTATTTPYVGTFIGNPTAVPSLTSATPVRTGPIYVVTGKPPTAVPGAVVVNPVVINPVINPAINPITNPGVPITNPPPSGIVTNCPTGIANEFAALYQNATISAGIGCPTAGTASTVMVQQRFQNGLMFWRETKEMWALFGASGTFVKTSDQWNETIPATDPGLAPPPGFSQPVRGFGYAWRSNTQIRDTLGWASTDEQSYTGVIQPFERGIMFKGIDGQSYALIGAESGFFAVG